MKHWKKLAMTAGAIGALGVAGSFGTFSAFTAADAKDVSVSSGTLKISGTFNLPDLTNLGTRESGWNCNSATGQPTGTSECWFGPDGKKPGEIIVTNTGSLPQDVYFDFDGPGGDAANPAATSSTNPLAESIIVDSSTTSDFTGPGDVASRLWIVNRRGPTKMFTLNAGDTAHFYYRFWLRESAPGQYANGDNELQGRSLNEHVTISAVEVGRDDLQIPQVVVGGTPRNWDFGA
jgi:hypothetical protein